MYAKCIKRVLDFTLSLIALLILSPVLLILMVVGAIAMRGNPFFTQRRPGRINPKTGKERIFRLIKFRTMDNRCDEHGNLLPDAVRLNAYGRFLRSTSLDELPELINILIGDMSIVGPRPLLVQYLPWYTEEERRRHTVRPGLTGLAQVNGRNTLVWEERFACDIQYISDITLRKDATILIDTIRVIRKRSDIVVRKADGSMDFDHYRKHQLEKSVVDCEHNVNYDTATDSQMPVLL